MNYSGSCQCGQWTVTVTTAESLANLRPRVCDCAYCQVHPSALVSDPSMRIELADRDGALTVNQNGDELASFYHCAGCSELLAVGREINGGLRGATNGLLFDRGTPFGERVPVQPRLLAPAEKLARWEKLWGELSVGGGNGDDFPSGYIPAGYARNTFGRMVLWTKRAEDAFILELLRESLAAVARLLDYELRRTLHVIVYATNEDARSALDRPLPPTALLAPAHTERAALIALQSPSADARNGDMRRMRRHLCHEIAHVYAAERTASVKVLGDGDRGMRVLPWVNEGFAECVAALAADRRDLVERALQQASLAEMPDSELDAIFCGLGSGDRRLASAIATSRVWRVVESRGIGFVFASLAEAEQFGG